MRSDLGKWSLLLAVAGVFYFNAPEPLTVTLPSGRLEGIRFSGSPDGVAFLGVPYAAPPVDALRWKPPLPALQWVGLRKADAFGPVCPQLPQGWLPYLEGKEDCLYLNVWTPQLSSNAKSPVIVFFHGGSNTAGYSQFTPLGGPLSQLGVVIVTANYRLGPFGFLAHPALTAESQQHSSGNYGLLDQMQALHWVHGNISQFGGDPARVTVMGQSSGAVDICLLLSSPLAKDLFRGAILESGECQSALNEDIRQPLPFNFIEDTGEAVGERLADDLGVPSGRNTLERLRGTPPQAILKAWSEDPHVHFDAIVDGWVVPEQPAKLFSEGKQLHVPTLVGSNADEATVFGDHGVKTVVQFRKYLAAHSGKFAGEEFSAYAVRSDADVPARRLELENDSFAYGAYSMALAMNRAGQKAYLYDFTFHDTGKRARLGAHHGLELSFLSDSFPSDWVRSAAGDQLGEFMRGYWAQFAKSGDPNYRGAPSWPAFDAGAEQCLELGRDIRARAVAPRLRVLQHIMLEVLAEASTARNKPN